MIPQFLPFNITCISFFLLGFISFLNPSKVNIIANRWFGVFLFSVGCMLLDRVIYDSHSSKQFIRLIAFNELWRFAIAPALYLSVLHFTSPGRVFKKVELLHFIPFVIFFIYMSPVVVFEHFTFQGVSLPPVVKSVMPVFVFFSVKIQVVLYWILAYYQLNQHQKNIELIASDTIPVNLNWLKFLLFGIAFLILLALSEVFIKLDETIPYAAYGYLFGTLFICYYMLAQKEIYPYEEADLAEVELIISNKEAGKEKSRISNELTQQLKDKLEKLMKTEKIFLDNELSLPQLAQQMSLSPHDLSYLLNDGLGVNFFQYVNSYRVEEAKQFMLSEKNKHLNILGIAYSAGFNSKTTFNTAFKKETGLSPSQFIKQAKATVVQVVA